jgi:cytochrome c oxidase assembly protein subunit 15
VAIHFVHRLGALATFTALLLIALYFRRSQAAAVRQAATLVLGAVSLQVLIGAGVVWFGLPLPLATAHNGVAALLLLAVINLNHAASFDDKLQPA